MVPCHAVQLVTPKKVVLNGLWLGPKKPKRAVVWVHGLGSSVFSKIGIAEKLVDSKTAVLMFNNRGHDKVVHVPHASNNFKKAIRGGAAHERFVDSIDDIQGALNFTRKQGVKSIYLAGHSTGCQKSVYWASKKGRGVKGIILLAPISDYDAIRLQYDSKRVARVLAVSHAYIKKGRGATLLPSNVWDWPWVADARRFVSLYSGKSAEEIFTYWDSTRRPRTLSSVRTPMLIFLAGKEEFSEIPAKEIAAWFNAHVRRGKMVIVPGVGHSFSGGEGRVTRKIREWMK